MTPGLCEQTIGELVKQYPAIQAEILTVTAYGRPVWSLTLGTGDRHVLYSAAHHANEWITTPLLLKFTEELAEAAKTGAEVGGVKGETVLNTATLHLVPMVNPDGVALVTGEAEPGSKEFEAARRIADAFPDISFPDGWKADLLGVDLNLQYPAGWLQAREIKFAQGFDRPAPRDYVGRFPLSQRETVSLADYTDEVNPDLVVAWHTQGKVIYWQFRDYEVPGARKLGEAFADVSGYALADTPYASSFAGYKDWFIRNYRRPGFTIEAGEGRNPLPIGQFNEIYRNNLGILVTGAMGVPE